MSDKSDIEWTDATWSPTLGCMKVSAGCESCYAIRTAYRQEHAFKRSEYAGLTRKLPDGSLNWTGRVNTVTSRLRLPLMWKKPRRIFVDSQSDLFHEDVPDEFIAKVFAVMALASRHTFQVLTKRPERMRRLMSSGARDGFAGAITDAGFDLVGPPWSFLRSQPGPTEPHNWPPSNVWLGVSVEDQRAADERIPLLLQTPAAVRFLSCEPLIGAVDLRSVTVVGDGRTSYKLDVLDGRYRTGPWEPGAGTPFCFGMAGLKPISWVITGGESGPRARPCDLDWVRSLRDQCQSAGVAYFFKQWGGRTPKAGGRELDGRTWDEYPEVVHV